MRESGDEKSTLRQIEKIKALSEDIIPQVGMLRRGHLWFLRRLVPCLVQLPVWCYLINLLFG